ncbi:MAG: hypothetical protein ABSD62_06920 [Candidatus Limnocylindrales bacterium]|jgi:hypothetical protein
MATARPLAGEDLSAVPSGRGSRVGKWGNLTAPRPRTDPRYRVLQRHDVREAVRVQIALAMAIVVGNMAFIGPQHVLTDLAAMIVLISDGVLLLGRRIVQRRPQATAVFSDVVLYLLVVVALIDIPDRSSLVIGSCGIVIVGSALFVPLDQRPHLIWLAFSFGLWLIALELAPIGDPVRVQGAIVAVGAVVTSAGGNRLVQARRERTSATEAMLRQKHRELREAVARLEAAMTTIANLEGILPICAHCKRIRDADDTWVRIETYVEERSGAQFSHGICPQCADLYFPGVLAEP